MATRAGLVVVSAQAITTVVGSVMGYQAANVFLVMRRAQLGIKLRRLRQTLKVAETVAKPITLPLQLVKRPLMLLSRPLRVLRRGNAIRAGATASMAPAAAAA